MSQGGLGGVIGGMHPHLLSFWRIDGEIQANVEEVDWSPGEDEDCACTNQKTVSPAPQAPLTRHSWGSRELENKTKVISADLLDFILI